MTDINKTSADQPFDEQIISEYLLDNPDFFERYPQLLLTMKMPHAQRGAVSLVERRQELLRSRVAQLEEEITQLLSMAARNEKIFRFNCDLSTELLNCDNFEQLEELLYARLVQQYGFIGVRLVKAHDFDSQLSTIWSKRLKYGYYFGRLTIAESRSLFGEEVGSVALTKLSEACGRVIFAIASQDAAHFHPEMDNMLLEQLRLMLDHQLSKF